ncbi:MFS transporter (plasmid) [Azospirillum argentinense]|uniref:MFS transporter n=1 Tax=Azospirillum argentinense TaxID=2970906 RepID=A0A4D8PTC2_9PROT|nr:MFS transporter [Azospirillum argentinense]QCN98201.1 MFS transporter [Azospirillum argentinense]
MASSGAPSGRSGPLRAFLVSVLLVGVTLAFSLSINLGSFRQNHADTLMAAFAVVGGKTVENVQDALGYGKPLDDFYGLEAILNQLAANLPWARGIGVAVADGRIVATARGRPVEPMAEATLRRARAELERRPHWFRHDADNGTYALYLPIRNPGEAERDGRTADAPAGFLIIQSDSARVDDRVEEFRDRTLPQLLWTGLGTVGFLGLTGLAMAFGLRRASEGRRVRLERLRRLLALGAMLAAQTAAAAECYTLISTAHLEAAEQATQIVARMIRNDVESVVRRGLDYGSLAGVDGYFERIRASMPTLRSIELALPGATPPTQEARHAFGGIPFLSDMPDVTLRWPLAQDRGGEARELVAVVDGDRVDAQLTEFGLDMATILVTSLLFMFEMDRVLGGRTRMARRSGDGRAEPVGPAPDASGDFAGPIRFSAFLMYFGAFLPVSFVPLLMTSFGRNPFPLLSPSQVAAAPLTAEMLFGVAAALAAGRLTGRLGWRVVSLAGFAAAAAGMALAAVAAVAADPRLFVLARGLSGAGGMAGLIAANALIGRLRGVSDTSALQSGLFAGMYAGVNCGAVSGALLSTTYGAVTVFAAGALIPLAGLLYTAFGVPRLPGTVPPDAHCAPAAVPSPGSATVRPRHRRIKVPLFLALISLPTAVAAMFLPFYLPLFIADLGLSSATVGRAYLLHGLCVVLAGPLLTRMAARRLPIPGVTLLSAAMIAGALALFGLQASLWTAFATVLLIGLAESFGLSAQIRHVELLAAREARRRDSVLALHVNTRKLGQAAGPILFGTLAAAVPLGAGPEGVGLIGGLLAGSLLLFALLTWRRAIPSHTRPSRMEGGR